MAQKNYLPARENFSEFRPRFEVRSLFSHNTKSLQVELSNIAGNMVGGVIGKLSSNSKLVSQKESDASYAKKITKDEAKVSWTSSCREIFCKVRAFIEWPVEVKYEINDYFNEEIIVNS